MMFSFPDLTAGALVAGRIVSVPADGQLLLAALVDGSLVTCRVLQVTTTASLTLAVDDEVLLHRLDDGQAVILGRIGPSHAPAPLVESGPADIPDELVLEAKQNLTLKCGDGSITIRADGKILIKGRDLVSHAQRTNRIRGGSVAIN